MQKNGIAKIVKGRANMPLKPNGALCRIREQIIEDAPSGLTLQFECDDGRLRIVIAGRALSIGNRELLFDDEGREAGAGTLVGKLRPDNEGAADLTFTSDGTLYGWLEPNTDLPIVG